MSHMSQKKARRLTFSKLILRGLVMLTKEASQLSGCSEVRNPNKISLPRRVSSENSVLRSLQQSPNL
jgi:hypothetical protein